MDSPQVAKDFSELEDVFSSLVALNLYTAICYCFHLPDASRRSQIIAKLEQGLETISTNFPWLAAQVIVEHGTSKIVPLEKKCRLIVKDLPIDAPTSTFEALRHARFPCSMLDGSTLGPLTGLPTIAWPSGDTTAPVFFIQANFVRGGLILNFIGEHSAMDGQGLGQVIRMFSKACHGEQLTDEELRQGNRVRTDIVPLLDPVSYKPGPELVHHFVHPSKPTAMDQAGHFPKSTWAFFHFSKSSLSKLKSLASASSSLTDNPAVSFITTNDAVTAFIWQSVSRVRASRFPSDTATMLVRAIDVRSALSVPATYLGNLHHHTYNALAFASIASASLASLASRLRLALEPSGLGYAVRSLATHATIGGNNPKITYGADVDFSKDIWFSSWAKLPCYEHDFDLGLGLPEAVRRPRSDAIESLMYLLPMDRDGCVDAAICLRDEDMESLRIDELWREYAEWIG